MKKTTQLKCAVRQILETVRKPSARFLGVSFVLVVLFNSYLPLTQEVQAQAVSQAVTVSTFEVTAYYSPLAGQAKYVTGSYDGDIRLNGHGVHGADGTPVYPGMVAAPQKYAFGTKMNIPGIGTVAVHDRGGAIVGSGNNQKYDRLDIWMGSGDSGLSRALGWGRRIVQITVYGIDSSIKEEVSFANFSDVYISPSSPARVAAKPVAPPMFAGDIWYMSHGSEVVKLQKTLQALGYFDSSINGYYGDETKQAIYAFQKDNGIFTGEDELGAGHAGPQTRLTLEKAFTERKKTLFPVKAVGKGSQGDDVTKLQALLKSLGYSVKITGVFDDQTEQAIYQFQLDNNIVKSEKQSGAGYFGPQTMTALEKQYMASISSTSSVAVVDVPNYLVQDLTLNATGDAVRQLQMELKRLNFLKVEPTGLYGPVTAHAVFKFKQSQGIVASLDDVNAQVFGPETRKRLNEIVASRFHTEKLLASKNPTATQATTVVATAASTKVATNAQIVAQIEEGLAKGGNATQTRALQQFLADKGYLTKSDVTGTFGDKTEAALITFQKAHRLIASTQDTGAGRVGPKTKALLLAFTKANA